MSSLELPGPQGRWAGRVAARLQLRGDPLQLPLVPLLNGQNPPHLNFPEEGEEPFAVCGAGFLPPPYAVAPREGSSRLALFLQVRVHQLPVNDPVHVILWRGRRVGISSCSYLVLGLDREVTNVGSR